MSKILIVDDEPQNVSALVRFLGDLHPDWEILTAGNESDAEDFLRNENLKGHPVDVLLTDLVMKDSQSGMRLLDKVRQIDPSVMTILFTANESHLDRYAAFEAGAFDIVEKNIRGVAASKELSVKTKAALQYKEWFRQITFARRYFDPKVFEMIRDRPEMLALRAKTVTIAFWDIRGFSLLCEVLKGHPELVADFLREYCEAAAQIVFSRDGVLDKFIGDGVMALFGVLASNEHQNDSDHARDAVLAAQEFRRSFNSLRGKWLGVWKRHTPQEINIGLGCGVHTGEVLVGNVGTSFRDQFTALGSHVNFAARIEGRSKDNQILVSQSVQARLGEQMKFVRTGEISDIKNIPGTYAIYELAADTVLTV